VKFSYPIHRHLPRLGDQRKCWVFLLAIFLRGAVGLCRDTALFNSGIAEHRTPVHPQQMNKFALLLVLLGSTKSSPPCRRVADTSRRRCGRPSSFCCHRGFPPLLCINVVVSVTRVLLFTVRYSLFSLVSFLGYNPRERLSALYNLLWFSSLLNASLVGAVFTVSGRLFHGSTTLTENEYFQVSVRAYCTARPWAAAVCLSPPMLRIPGVNAGSRVFTPDPGSEFFHPGSRVKKIPDKDPHQRI
jgi:hypothetical protein